MNSPCGKSGNDLFAVEASIFDEDFAVMISADHHSRQINSGDIAFVSLRIHGGLIGCRVQRDSHRTQEIEVRMVAG